MIPSITRYKGNHQNPNIIWVFFQNFPKNFQNFQKHIFRDKFFISKKKSRNFSGHLCRSEIFQRFQKSYLENQPIKLKVGKNQYSKLAVQISAIYKVFDVLLRGATLNRIPGGNVAIDQKKEAVEFWSI